MISLPTREQWLSVLRNTVIAFVSAFAVTLSTSTELSVAAIRAAAVAGIVASGKVLEKLFSEPRLG
jgi:hypothetical protein